MARKFGILGHPLGHTMSPPIHERLFALSGHSGEEYAVYDVPPEQLAARQAELLALDGLNVTIPYKVELLGQMDALDETAGRFGALNVIARRGGRLTGYNTDCYGFLKTVELLGARLEPGRRVCVLGAGGVGRMFAISAALAGAEVTLAVRESGMELARRVGKDMLALAPGASIALVDIAALGGGFGCHLLINATPVGMYPSCEAMPVCAEALPGCEFVFDCVYNPTETLLMQTARKAGCNVAGGMAMLVWQAVRAHEIWDGAKYENSAVQAIISEMEQRVNRDFPRP